MAAVPKFGSFKPKPSSATVKETDPIPDRDGRRKRERRHHHHRANEKRSGSRDERLLHHAEDENARHRHPSEHQHHRSFNRRGKDDEHQKVIANEQSQKSDLFFVDRRGDRKNVEYGSLHRYSIPTYHPIGYGRLIGAPSSVKINRDESDEKSVVLSAVDRGAHHKTKRLLSGIISRQPERRLRAITLSDPADGVLDMQSDFVSLRPNLKRKRGSKSPGQEDTVNYRSIEGKAKPSDRPADEDLEYASDSDIDTEASQLEVQVRQENAALARWTKDRPTDVEAWLALIEHQLKVVHPGADTTTLTGNEKRTLADIRLAIYEKALKQITKGKPGHERLVLGMMEEGSLIWENSKLEAKWAEALEDSSASIVLWTKYLDFVQTSHINFRYEKCKDTYVQCLKVLNRARSVASSANNGIGLAQISVFLRFTTFIQDSGYDELAYALWQLLLEYHFFKPPDPPNAETKMDALEDLWDSDVPRIGEEGAQGWSQYARNGDRNVRAAASHILQPLDKDRLFLSFAEQELGLMLRLHLPATADDDSAMPDPFRHVMFSDVRGVIEAMSDDLSNSSLIDAFLVFMHLPPCLDDNGESKTQDWQADQFLHTVSVGSDLDGPVETNGSDIVINEWHTASSLFRSAFRAFSNRITALGDAGKDFVAFVDRVLGMLVVARSQDDSLVEYFIAYRAQLSGRAAALKMAKRLLKARPSSLRLQNVYALVKGRCSETEIGTEARKANGVWVDRVRASTRKDPSGHTRTTVNGWFSIITEEIDRFTQRKPGYNENTVRSTFTRALLDPASPVMHSIKLWTMWFRFEHPELQSPRGLTDAQKQQALMRAKRVFLDGLRYLPWSKAWVIMGLHAFARDGGMSQRELRQVYDVLAERELRVRVGLDETEDVFARMDGG